MKLRQIKHIRIKVFAPGNRDFQVFHFDAPKGKCYPLRGEKQLFLAIAERLAKQERTECKS